MFDIGPAPDLQPHDLVPVLEAAVGWPGRISSLIVEPIPYSVYNRAAGGVFRVNVTMGAGGMVPQLILKVVRYRPWTPTLDELRSQLDNGGDAPDDVAWWRREGEVFRSGLSKAYGPPFRAVRCYLVQDRAPDEQWIWLEQAPGLIGYNWPEETLLQAAHALGRVQAAAAPLSPPPWLARPLVTLESTVHRAELLALFDDPRSWANPAVAAFVRPETARLAQRCWAAFDAVREALRSFPQILSHGDLGPYNAFSGAQNQFVAIDWAMARMGPRGEDLAALVLATVGTPDDPHTVVERGERAMDAYIAGLAAGGWSGDETEIRFTYRAFAAAQLGLLLGVNAHKAMDADWIASKGPDYDLMADMQKRFSANTVLLEDFARDPIARTRLG